MRKPRSIICLGVLLVGFGGSLQPAFCQPVERHADIGGLKYEALSQVDSLAPAVFAISDTTPAAGLEDIQGLWRSDGYGWVIRVAGSKLDILHVTEVACLPNPGGDVRDMLSALERIKLGPGGHSFTAYTTENVTRFSFRKLDSLPAACRGNGSISDDPLLNFEALWQGFHEHYAFFDVRGVDWYRTYHQHRPRVTPATSADELFAIFVDMLAPLRDRHVTLTRSGMEEYRAGLGPFFAPVRAAHLERHGSDGNLMQAYWDALQPYKDVVDDNMLAGEVRRAAGGLVVWGTLADGSGYLRLDAMAGFAGDAPHAEQLRTLAAALDEALETFRSVDGVVIDLRFNLGGNDGLALHVAGRFADRQRPAFVKYAKHGNTFTEAQAFNTVPTGPSRFTGPIAVLISDATVSAGENLTMFLMQFPYVTLIGERTATVHSDELLLPLPNGWQATISNEVFAAPDGTIYEGRGIPPEVVVPYFTSDVLESGQDPVIEAAMSHLRAEINGAAP